MLSGKFGYVYTFKSEELAFYVGACGVASEGVVGSYYTVTGNDYGDGVVTYCTAYGLGRHGVEMVFGSD